MQQKADLAAEAKSVLDSWVRYEGQVKARQQKELAESVIAKIEKSLSDPKVLDQILKQSVSDVERKLYPTTVLQYDALTRPQALSLRNHSRHDHVIETPAGSWTSSRNV